MRGFLRNLIPRSPDKKEVGNPTRPEEIPVGNQLSALSRRTVLKGAAAVATSPDKMVHGVAESLPQDVVERAAAQLVPFAKMQLMLSNTDVEPTIRKMEQDEYAQARQLVRYLSNLELSLPDKNTAVNISNAFRYIENLQLGFTPSSQLRDFQNPRIIAKAYKLAGAEEGKHPGEYSLREFGEMLQEGSGLPNTPTLHQIN